MTEELPVVHPGGFCAPAGACGVTTTGTRMICRVKEGADRARWGRDPEFPAPPRTPRKKKGSSKTSVGGGAPLPQVDAVKLDDVPPPAAAPVEHRTYIDWSPGTAMAFGYHCKNCLAVASGYKTSAEVLKAANAHGPLAADSPIPGDIDDEYAAANRQQAEADRRLAARLAESDAAGNLTTHGPGESCELGSWHEGPCPPNGNLEIDEDAAHDSAVSAGDDEVDDLAAEDNARMAADDDAVRIENAAASAGAPDADQADEPKSAADRFREAAIAGRQHEISDEDLAAAVDDLPPLASPTRSAIYAEKIRRDNDIPFVEGDTVYHPNRGKVTYIRPDEMRRSGDTSWVRFEDGTEGMLPTEKLTAEPVDRSADAGTDWSVYSVCPICGADLGAACHDLRSPGSLNATPHEGRPRQLSDTLEEINQRVANKQAAEEYRLDNHPAAHDLWQHPDRFVGQTVTVTSAYGGEPRTGELESARYIGGGDGSNVGVRLKGVDGMIYVDSGAPVEVHDRSADSGTDWSRYDDCPVCSASAGQPCRDLRTLTTGGLNATAHDGRPLTPFGSQVTEWEQQAAHAASLTCNGAAGNCPVHPEMQVAHDKYGRPDPEGITVHPAAQARAAEAERLREQAAATAGRAADVLDDPDAVVDQIPEDVQREIERRAVESGDPDATADKLAQQYLTDGKLPDETAPSADDIADAINAGHRRDLNQAEVAADLAHATEGYDAAGDEQAAADARKVAEQFERGLMTPDEAREQLLLVDHAARQRAAASDDQLDDLEDRQLRSLATEYELPHGADTPREELIGSLREAGARNPYAEQARADVAGQAAAAQGQVPQQRPPVTGDLTDKPIPENEWGYGGGPVAYHPDGEVGVAVERMGRDAQMDVDGQPLGEVLGRVATDVVSGRRTAQEGLEEYRAVRDRLPEGSAARRSLNAAIERMDAPATPAPAVPDSAPAPLRDLMEKLHSVPMVRRGGPHYGEPSETEQLAALLGDFEAGRTGGLRFVDQVRSLANQRHESHGDQGKLEIDRAVHDAVEELMRLRKETRGQALLPQQR